MANFPFQRLQADLADLIARTPAGQRLVSEPELAKQLGVSRATLREALVLEHMGDFDGAAALYRKNAEKDVLFTVLVLRIASQHPDRDALVGSYTYGSGPRDHFTIEVRTDMLKREQLTIERAGAPSRQNLYHVGNLVFFPTGVPSTKIAFAREGAKITQLTVADPNVILTARRN